MGRERSVVDSGSAGMEVFRDCIGYEIKELLWAQELLARLTGTIDNGIGWIIGDRGRLGTFRHSRGMIRHCDQYWPTSR
jgi:hypothetical protein